MAAAPRTPWIRFYCPKCRHALRGLAVNSVNHSRMTCPNCSQQVHIPQHGADAASGRPLVLWPCPQCENPLRLIAELHQRKIRCTQCEAVLAVSTRPWALDVLDEHGAAGHGAATDHGPTTVAADEAARAALAAAQQAPAEGQAAEKPAAAAWVSRAGRSVEKGVDGKALLRTLAKVAAAAGGLAVLVIAAWMFRGSLVRNERLRYLPDACSVYNTFSVPAWTTSRLAQRGREFLPDPPRMALYQSFLNSTGLALNQVARISFAGDKREAAGNIIAYELTQAVDPVQFISRSTLAAQRQREETVAGKPFVSMGNFAVAFPDLKVVLVGRTETLRSTLERSADPAPDAFRQAVTGLDATQTIVAAYSGAPTGALAARLLTGTDLAPRILTAADELNFNDGLHARRVLQMPNPPLARELATFLEDKSRRLADDKRTPADLVRLVKLTKIACKDQQVILEIAVAAASVDRGLVEIFNRYFF